MTRPVDYDAVAAGYSSRYEQNDYAGVRRVLARFTATAIGTNPPHVLEVGCGTGHWLQFLGSAGIRARGIDLSWGMLCVARAAVPAALLVRGQAEALPVLRESCDRVFCINALHHFADPAAFFREARRVVRAGGGLLTVGLDPHTGQDQWWIYDYFPEALAADRKRYLPSKAVRELMQTAGFDHCETREVQRLPRELPASEAARRGFLERRSTSQLMVITDEEYEAGLCRILSADSGASSERILRADLRLYGTFGSAA